MYIDYRNINHITEFEIGSNFFEVLHPAFDDGCKNVATPLSLLSGLLSVHIQIYNRIR